MGNGFAQRGGNTIDVGKGLGAASAFLGERLEPFELAGMLLIMASLIIIDGRMFRR